MRTVCVVAAVLFAISCRGSGKCAPVSQSIMAMVGVPVYAACQVTEQARVLQQAELPDPGMLYESVCWRADYWLVVDQDGFPLPETARLAGTNNSRFGELGKSMLGTARFTAAKLNGEYVHQLVQYRMKFEYTAMRPGQNSITPRC